MQKCFLLPSLEPEADVDFLNVTPILFAFVGETNDSGWCDASTGARILNKQDRIIFRTNNTEDELALTVKFGDRLTYLPDVVPGPEEVL